MERIDFRTAFFGGRGFGFGENDPREKWMKMTTEEKVEFIDKRMEAMNGDSAEQGGFHGRGRGMGDFFGGKGFAFGENDPREKWMKMTTEEKVEFIDKRMEAMNGDSTQQGGFQGRGREFSIEAFDSLCEKWIKMSTEEKEAYLKSRTDDVNRKMAAMGNPFGGREGSFGFGFGR